MANQNTVLDYAAAHKQIMIICDTLQSMRSSTQAYNVGFLEAAKECSPIEAIDDAISISTNVMQLIDELVENVQDMDAGLKRYDEQLSETLNRGIPEPD